jgi:hypothetical protein
MVSDQGNPTPEVELVITQPMLRSSVKTVINVGERGRVSISAAGKMCPKTFLQPKLSPGKFYKKESQEKTPPQRLEFFLLRSPLDGAGSVLNCHTRRSVAGHFDAAVWVFSTSGFHCLFATKPVSSETSKAERGQIWRPWFYPGLVAHSFFWLSERA